MYFDWFDKTKNFCFQKSALSDIAFFDFSEQLAISDDLRLRGGDLELDQGHVEFSHIYAELKIFVDRARL